MLESILTASVIKQMKKNLKAENPQKLNFILNYLTDKLLINCEDIKKDKKYIIEGETLKLSECSQLAFVLTSQLKKRVKFSEIHLIKSIWDISGPNKTMKNEMYFLDIEGNKKSYSETIKI